MKTDGQGFGWVGVGVGGSLSSSSSSSMETRRSKSCRPSGVRGAVSERARLCEDKLFVWGIVVGDTLEFCKTTEVFEMCWSASSMSLSLDSSMVIFTVLFRLSTCIVCWMW
jgi:hypothetical protein